MKQIITIEQAENFINNYDLYKSKAENQTNLFSILEKCEALAVTNSNNKLLCKTRIFLTNYYIQINDFENALKVGLENHQFSKIAELEEENLRTYSGLIEIYNSIGDYAKLEELIHEYQEKLINKNDYNKLCTLYIILAMQANNLKNHENNLKYNRQAIEYGKISENINLLVYAYNNLGFQYMEQDISIAQDALENALELIKHHQKDISNYSIAVVELNLSRLYLKQQKYDLSLQLIKSSIKILKKINNNNELNSAKLVLSELYIDTNKLKSALILLEEIEKKCIENKNRSVLATCYHCYIKLFEKKKKYKETLESYKKLQAVNEEMYNEETNKKIYNLQTLYEVKSIKKQRDHAETIANLKHDFLANMSHEIRTPINSVLGISYLFQQTKLNKKQQDYVNRLQRSGESLLSLINDVLDLSKIEAGKMELISVEYNLHTFIQNIYDQLSYKAAEKNLKLNIKAAKELDIAVVGDENRLTQVILNLVMNAIKFTNKGAVLIEMNCLSNDAKKLLVEFKIIDTGIGITQNKIDTIFERYEQVTGTSVGGTGLGLSISKKILDLMDAKIDVSSKINKGTTFSVTIPFEKSQSNTIKSNEVIDISADFLYHKNILIADDIEENRMILRDILQSFNSECSIDEVSNGIEVMDIIKNKSYDLILMDLDMPDKNGIETMLEIRKIEKLQSVKIIAHTAGLLTISKDEMIEIGFNELLLKPFKPLDFLKKLTILMS